VNRFQTRESWNSCKGILIHEDAEFRQVAVAVNKMARKRVAKTGGRLVKHARYYWLMLAASHLARWLFGRLARPIAALLMSAG
jgi:hypothetical protein